MRHRYALLICLYAFLSGAASAQGGIRPGNVANDIHPGPGTVEVILTAMESVHDFGTGNETAVWTYNGSIPGPTIEANVGDTLIVHFTNQLPEETTIHWHGLEIPADMDGSHIAQTPVPPGGSFRYEFVLPRAALFWYHPHVRTNAQVEKGLHGALLVHDPAQDQALGLPTREHVLVLDDVLLDENGQIADPWPTDPAERAAMHVNGREGNALLINGRANFRATITNGVPHRLRMVNVANARFMRISIPGHFLWRIGGDGGLLERPLGISPLASDATPDSGHDHKPVGGAGMGSAMMPNQQPDAGLMLTPGERADVIVFPAVQDSIIIEWHDIARGRHNVTRQEDGSLVLGHAHDDGQLPPHRMGTLRLSGEPGFDPYVPPSQLRQIERIDATGAPVVPVMFGHGNPTPEGNVVFFAQMKDGMPLPYPMVTPEDAPTIEVGETRVWSVNNMTGGDHNFHMHGFHFQHIETEYIDMETPENNRILPAPYLEDKDTIFLPRRPGAKGMSRTITRLAVRHDDEGREGRILAGGKVPMDGKSGGWLFHCHLLEHSAAGMMSFFQIVSASTSIDEALTTLPTGIKLEENFPNPFNPQTMITFHLPATSNAAITIYNNLGQQIRELISGEFEAGTHHVRWDGLDDRGERVASGVYFYRLRSGLYADVKRMTLLQ